MVDLETEITYRDIEALGERIFFHVGYPRTGSTFLQKHIFQQCRGKALVYSEKESLGLPHLTDFFTREDEFRKGKHYFSGWPGLSNFLKEACEDKAKPIIYSSETLSGDVFKDNYDVPERIQSTFPKSRILVCLRSQYTVIPSLYSYVYIKSGGSLSYGRYVQRVIENDKLNYLRFVGCYLKLFGSENVRVMLYEDFKAHQERFLTELLEYMKLPPVLDIREGEAFRNPRFPVLVVKGSRVVNTVLETGSLKSIMERLGVADNQRARVRSVLTLGLLAVERMNSSLKLLRLRPFEDEAASRERIRQKYASGNRDLFKILNRDPVELGYPA